MSDRQTDLFSPPSRGGRKRNPFWQYFQEIENPEKKYKKAECKICHKQISGIRDRMAKHIESCCKGQLLPDKEMEVSNYLFINHI